MTQFDNELKNALRRHNAPDGFADRLLARLAEEQPPETNAIAKNSLVALLSEFFRIRPWIGWAASAALALILIVGTIGYRQVQIQQARERAAGESAKQRLILALRIAGGKLQLAKTKVNQINAMPAHSGSTENLGSKRRVMKTKG